MPEQSKVDRVEVRRHAGWYRSENGMTRTAICPFCDRSLSIRILGAKGKLCPCTARVYEGQAERRKPLPRLYRYEDLVGLRLRLKISREAVDGSFIPMGEYVTLIRSNPPHYRAHWKGKDVIGYLSTGQLEFAEEGDPPPRDLHPDRARLIRRGDG